MVLPLRSLPPEGKTQVQVNKYNKGTQALYHPLAFITGKEGTESTESITQG
jgi:hypothetical protein